MSNNTKKQHYVWRKYLSLWVTDRGPMIWTFNRLTNEVKQVGLMSVAQKSNIYKLYSLSEDELKFLQSFSSSLPSDIQITAQLLLDGYLYYNTLLKDVSVPTQNNTLLKQIEIQTFENIQSRVEKMGDKLLQCNNIQSINELVDEEIDILYYLAVQYFRTQRRKQALIDSMPERKNLQALTSKAWPFFNFVFAEQLVESMVRCNDYRFVFLHNNTKISYITSDQPIINSKSDCQQDKLELYYPLFPQRALKISFDAGEKYSEEYLNEEDVLSLNSKMIEDYDKFLFANKEQQLKNY